jgi:hypothetical protein
MAGCAKWAARSGWALCLLCAAPLFAQNARVSCTQQTPAGQSPSYLPAAPLVSGDASLPRHMRGRPAQPAAAQALTAMMQSQVRYDDLPAIHRDNVRLVLDKPTIKTQGPLEVFRGSPDFYMWLLDNPDQAVQIWRKLGAKCMDIHNRGDGHFGWTDKNGSDIGWQTIHRGPNMRIWYSEGSAKPTPWLPAVPVRAVAIMRYAACTDSTGRVLIHHRAELAFLTDSKAAALITQMMGNQSQLMAQQCVAQMELFFSGLVWYLDQHPERYGELGLCWWNGVPGPNAVVPAFRR